MGSPATGGGSSVVVGGTCAMGQARATVHKRGLLLRNARSRCSPASRPGGQLDPGFGSRWLSCAWSQARRRCRRRGGGSGGGARRRQAPDRRRTVPNRDRGWHGPVRRPAQRGRQRPPELRRGWAHRSRLSLHGGELGAAAGAGVLPQRPGQGEPQRPRAASSAPPSRSAPASRGRGCARSVWTCCPVLRLRKGFEARRPGGRCRQHRGQRHGAADDTEERALQAAPAVRRIRAAPVPAGDAAPGPRCAGSVPRATRRFQLRVSAYFVKDGDQYAGWQKVTRRVARAGR